jgi:serine/threonine protein kinase
MHATVYKCYLKEDLNKINPLAVKIVREEDEEKIMAHQNEFKIMSEDLNHKNIVKSKEIYINHIRKEVHQVMDFVDGMEVFD